jgi:menaquinone-dependent protoporphyrinogen oxidase
MYILNKKTHQASDTQVIGGNGKTGRRVVERLKTHDIPVRIGSRAGEPPFDWEDPTSWEAVLQGKDQTRRGFIFGSAKIIGAVIGAAALVKELVVPQALEAGDVQYPESNCGSKNKGGHKILIAYASEFGSTGEVAEAIGDVLCEEGNTVETKWIKNVKDLNNYDAVIIGSAIQYDGWMSEATEFVKANQKILQNLPVAYFFCCLALSKQTKEGELKATGYSDKLQTMVPQVKPVSIGRFAGVLDYTNMSFFRSLILKAILFTKGVKKGDYRDWDAIRLWAKGIHIKLSDERSQSLTPVKKM